MSLDAFKNALDALDEPVACERSQRLVEPIAIRLRGGDVARADDPGFVRWLLDHAEPAPFGQGGETKLDPTVRHAYRLVPRGDLAVSGFDLAPVIAEIEQVLSPRHHLEATLTDVLVYPPGGHFALHKDTPSSPELVGTLVVGLPIPHTGGAFRIEDGPEVRVVDWSGPVDPELLRWVALFTDADHTIEPVTTGARVTLVYALSQSGRARADASWQRRVASLRAAALRLELPGTGPLMIACTRHVIAPDGEQPQGIQTLRGTDRDIAEALAGCGFAVVVRTCVVARYRDADGWESPAGRVPGLRGEGAAYFARLGRPLLESDVAALLEAVVFGPHAGGDGGGFLDSEASSLAPYIVDRVPAESWVFRRRAAATFLREIEFSDYDFVGNDANEAYLYKLAALEVTRAG